MGKVCGDRRTKTQLSDIVMVIEMTNDNYIQSGIDGILWSTVPAIQSQDVSGCTRYSLTWEDCPMFTLRFAMMAGVILSLFSSYAPAAELKILSVGAPHPLLQSLIPEYERATGHKVSASFGPPALLQRRLMKGEAADLVFSFQPTWGELITAGKIESAIEIARVGIGVGIRKGSAKPNLADSASTKAFLLSARAISGGSFNTGSVGSWVLRAFDKMGITNEMLPKYKSGYKTGTAIIEAVAKGEADVVLSVMPDLADSRIIDYVGPFPPDVQQYDTALGAVIIGTPNETVARQFLSYVTRPELANIYREKWLYPLR